jgi:LacI family transcriptional regulator
MGSEGLESDGVPLIALAARPNPFLLKEAKVRNWRLIFISNYVPKHIQPSAALVEGSVETTFVQELMEMKCPVVRMGLAPQPDGEIFPAVIHDQEAQGEAAADHFWERSFRNVAYFGHDPWYMSEDLFKGFEKRSIERNVTCHLFRLNRIKDESSEAKRERTYQSFLNWINDLPKPIGLLTPGAVWAERMSFWLYRNGFRVPEDVAMLSRSRAPEICECCMPTVSEIDIDEEGRINKACDLLGEILKGENPPLISTKIAPKGVIERESTRVLATNHPLTQRAIQYMWSNYQMDLSVEDVAKEIGSSKRTLQRLFQQEFGRGVNEELRRKRLDEVVRLLVTTKLNLNRVCDLTGIKSTSYLHRAFHDVHGITPSEFRKIYGSKD